MLLFKLLFLTFQKLAKLEEEEDQREKEGYYELDYYESDDEMKEVHSLARKIREKIVINRINHTVDKPRKGNAVVPRASRPRERSVTRLKATFTDLGVDMTETEGCNFTRTSSLSRPAPKRFRSASATPRPRSLSTPRDEMGVKTPQVIYYALFHCECHIKMHFIYENILVLRTKSSFKEIRLITSPFHFQFYKLILFPIYRRLTRLRNA